mmetsp:Transcript_44866/g.81846  ORF Transcript_44866/g.81846 Transcript_44866/m.81846 type:complete len:336 (-) Transcript_44866:183-1190(-)
MAVVASRPARRPVSAVQGKRTVATRFEALEQNALQNLHMLHEHRRGIDAVVERRRAAARAQAAELQEFSKQLLKPVSGGSISGMPSPRGPNMSDRCFALEDTALRNEVMLTSHRETLDAVTQARQARSQKMELFAAQMNEAWGDVSEATAPQNGPAADSKEADAPASLDISVLESNMKKSQEALEERCRRVEEHVQEMAMEYERRKALRRPVEVGAEVLTDGGQDLTARSSRTCHTPRTEEEKAVAAEIRRSMLFGSKAQSKVIDSGSRLRQRPSSVCSMKARCHAITNNLNRNKDQLQSQRQELIEAHRRQKMINEQAAETARFMEEFMRNLKR